MILRRRAATPIVIGILLALAGCATGPSGPLVPPPAAQDSESQRWTRHLATMYSLTDWEVRGKVAYRLASDAGSASLQWLQEGARSQVRLSGPLGAGTTRITSEGALLRVERDGVERLYPSDAAPWLPNGELLPVPVDSIRHWLRGVPDPASPAATLELEGGLARRIVQQGWEIDYTDFRDERGLALPSRLTLTAPAADLRLRIILRDWQLP